MNTKEFIEFIPKFMDKIKELKLKENTIWVNNWIVNLFKEYCLSKNILTISEKEVKKFYEEKFEFDIANTTTSYQTVLRRPMFALIEYYYTGNISKIYLKKEESKLTGIYSSILNYFLENSKNNLSKSSLDREKRVIENFLNFINEKKIDLITLDINKIIEYIQIKYSNYSSKTKATYKGILKKFLNWLFENKYITFRGNEVFPIIIKNNRSTIIPKGYSNDEIKLMLESIDNSTKMGKLKYLILNILVYYGMRAVDIVNLKFENINFENNCISIIQHKTQKSLYLPLISEVKYALIDYIKNSRPESEDKEHIILTHKAPYTTYNSNSISSLISNIIKASCKEIDKRETGGRILRHSLATNMINANVELYKISGILGHSSTSTTSVYITRDTKNLGKLTLEVPDGN